MEQETLKKLAPLISNDFFELILLPTESCNFRCSYCYEDFKLGTMSSEVVDRVKKLLSRRMPVAKKVVLNWFGGEPLLAKNIVLDISRHAQDLASYRPGLTCKGIMTTNGYLLDGDTLKELVDAGVSSFQVTIDGPRDVHNRTRLHRHPGKDTFETIWKNLLAVRDSGLPVSVTLRMHFDAHSHNRLQPIIEDIRNQLLPSGQFKVFFRQLSRLGGTNDKCLPVLSQEEYQVVLDKLHRQLGAESCLKKLNNYICYAAHANSLVIRADATVAKCTVAFRDPRNRIGILKLDGRLEIEHRKLAFWLRGLETMDSNLLSCPFKATVA